MEILLYTVIFLAFLYGIFTLYIAVGWFRVSGSPGADHPPDGVTVIIPLRNERSNVGPLLHGLEKQNFPRALTQFIFVDDHSTDNSVALLKGLLAKTGILHYTVLLLPEKVSGKKAAIELGMREAMNDLVLVTDADCLHKPDWIKLMIGSLRGKSDMVIGPVLTAKSQGFLSGYSFLEQAGLTSVTLGSAGMHTPLLCSAANLAYRKTLFHDLKGYEGNRDTASGDDMFLLRKTVIAKRRISHTKSEKALVITQPADDAGAILQQRLRWAGKWRKLGDMRLTWLGVLSLALNAGMLITPLFSGISGIFHPWHLAPLGLKILCDFLLVFLPAFEYRRMPELLWFLPAFFLNMFLVFGLGFMMITGKKTEWKGRTLPT